MIETINLIDMVWCNHSNINKISYDYDKKELHFELANIKYFFKNVMETEMENIKNIIYKDGFIVNKFGDKITSIGSYIHLFLTNNYKIEYEK